MKKKRLAYIDYWSHKTTRSGDFLREILNKEYEIVNFWWRPNEIINIKEIDKFDTIFFFHAIFPHQILKKFKNKKIMWAPMYDALNFTNPFFASIFWKQMSNLGIKILMFSDKIKDSLGHEDIKTLKLSYFIKPTSLSFDNDEKINIFFWNRGRIQLKDWLNFFDKKHISQIVYFPNPDQRSSNLYFKIPHDSDRKLQGEYNIKYIDKQFLPKEEYLALIEKCNVFIAPRKKEGIGLTIVEAISKGMYIVGYNDSTVNEYITDKRIGFLYDDNTITKINPIDILKNYSYRKNFAETNYRKWCLDKKKIIPLLQEENKLINKPIFLLLFLIDDIKFYIKKFFNINFYFRY